MLGRDPWRERDALMRDVCFIADVAVLPRWLRVSDALDVSRRRPSTLRPREGRGASSRRPASAHGSKVRDLSKGMVTQLHLALVMAIDARLLVLDEPTLGLDLLFRKQFYDALLGDYLDRNRTVLLATHQVDEVEHVLTDLLFIDRGRIVFNHTMEEVEADYQEVLVRPDKIAEARTLQPLHERDSLGRTVMLFAGAGRERLTSLGEVRTPAIADLFLAVVGGASTGGGTGRSRAMSTTATHDAPRGRGDNLNRATALLVGAARAVGAPLALRGAAGGRRAHPGRLHDRPGRFAGEAPGGGCEPAAWTSAARRAALHVRCAAADGHRRS